MNGKYVAAALLLSVMSPFSATAAADGLSLPQGGAKQVEDSFDRRNFTFSKLGGGQYSLLLYNQPWVKAQKQTTNGWSLNLTQNIGKKFAVFARVNGVSGSVAEIRQSWVLGMVYNNPFDRNPLDQAGLAFACNKIDEAAAGERLAHDSEKIVEAYYAFGISKWMTVTPDVQLYIDPALNEKSDYGAAFSLRFSFFF